jgi:hypothetical protein
MTSTFGYDTAYSVISDYYLNLAPNCNDKVFGTNVNYCNLVKSGIVDGQENDPAILNKYESLYKSLHKSINAQPVSDSEVTIKSVLEDLPNTSVYRSSIQQTGWDKWINTSKNITLFVPSDQSFSNAYRTWLNSKNIAVTRDVLKAHTLPYKLEHEDVQDRLIRVNTMKDSFSFMFDDTARVLPYANVYTPSYAMMAYTYPHLENRIKVLETYEIPNLATIYVIDGVFKPISK